MIAIETLKEVDAWVRERVTYERDKPVWNIPEDWKTPDRTLADGKGDCEDFALLAAHRLKELGEDPARMFLCLCHTKGGEGLNHAFLAVETPFGLHTCADTADKFGEPAYVHDAYPEEYMRRWMRISEPEDWRTWATSD